jgi:hypothetical protein
MLQLEELDLSCAWYDLCVNDRQDRLWTRTVIQQRPVNSQDNVQSARTGHM